MTDSHLDPAQIAAYVERGLSPADAAEVEAHLAGCAQCRAEAVAAARAVGSERRRRRRLIAAPVVGLAAVVTLVVLTDPFPRREPSAVALRPGDTAGREGVRSLAAYLPAQGATVPRPGLRFVWQRDGPDARYRFTLADPAGLPVWQTTTGDTALQLPDSVALLAGARYVWYVDVLLPDARTATTGVREFALAP